MEKFDRRVDTYIENSADFARPILIHIRDMVHRVAPEICETIKWAFPHFEYKGTVCHMASFKQHCTFGFRKASLLPDPNNLLNGETASAMGQFGRITTLSDLPSDDILELYLRNAILLNETGVKLPAPKKSSATSVVDMPEYFVEALSKNPLAKSAFEGFSNSHKKEYLEWITEAKTEKTREKRLATTLLWLSEGKSMNWRYKK
ncbi:hypothetical protein GZH53_09750 [Flavihumibacter sp. R14]|nr:hypothetical protein [Flavihumibacter soli]